MRTILSAMGVRYRLNVPGLPGRPDLANRSRKKAIFVHGCFWHYHEGCSRGRIPKSNREFWSEKLHANRRRDQVKVDELIGRGFDVLVVWECELKDKPALRRRLLDFWVSDRVMSEQAVQDAG